MQKFVLPLVLLAAAEGIPQIGYGAGPAPAQPAAEEKAPEHVTARALTEDEREIIRHYYAARGGSIESLMQETMPPSLARRTGVMTPDAASEGRMLSPAGIPGGPRRLPADLELQLPARGPEFVRLIVGNDVVLVDSVTNEVLDALRDVVTDQ